MVLGTLEQREGVPLMSPLYVSGPPGCGKTFMVLSGLNYLEQQSGGR